MINHFTGPALKMLLLVLTLIVPALAQESSAPAVPEGAVPEAQEPTNEQPYCDAIAKGMPHGPELTKACEFVESLRYKLPNVICEQTTRRYEIVPDTFPVLRDVITAQVTHDRSGEQYSDVRVNGKPTEAGLWEMQGQWSLGEFGGDLLAIFEPQAQARFKFVKEGALRSTATYLFEFRVAQENNRSWSLVVPKASVQTALRGKFWLRKTNAQIMRVEIEAVNPPDKFPIRKLSKKIDYAVAKLGDGTDFVLPTSTEGIVCSQLFSNCSKNAITFRNCHKFAAKSRILPGVEY